MTLLDGIILSDVYCANCKLRSDSLLMPGKRRNHNTLRRPSEATGNDPRLTRRSSSRTTAELARLTAESRSRLLTAAGFRATCFALFPRDFSLHRPHAWRFRCVCSPNDGVKRFLYLTLRPVVPVLQKSRSAGQPLPSRRPERSKFGPPRFENRKAQDSMPGGGADMRNGEQASG